MRKTLGEMDSVGLFVLREEAHLDTLVCKEKFGDHLIVEIGW